MRTLYAGDKYVCQTVIWPPKKTLRGWELDILCSPELMGMLPHLKHCAFRVDDIEFTGLEMMMRVQIVVPEDEMVKVTLIFQHCATAETDAGVSDCIRPMYTFGLTHRIDADI